MFYMDIILTLFSLETKPASDRQWWSKLTPDHELEGTTQV